MIFSHSSCVGGNLLIRLYALCRGMDIKYSKGVINCMPFNWYRINTRTETRTHIPGSVGVACRYKTSRSANHRFSFVCRVFLFSRATQPSKGCPSDGCGSYRTI